MTKKNETKLDLAFTARLVFPPNWFRMLLALILGLLALLLKS